MSTLEIKPGPTIIKPTVGRVVWYWPDHQDGQEQPFAATVAYVLDERTINIGYLDHAGGHHDAVGVHLIQEGDERPASGAFCEWMPYQLGQARAARG